MADTQLYPQDYSLDSCKIITSSGKPYEFRHITMEFNYYEDLYGNFITGDITINDSVGYLSALGFNGHEHIIFAFSKPAQPNSKIEKTFRIYKVSNRHMVKDQNETYTLHFCSEEAILSEQYKVSKSYPNKKISDIVKDIVINQLKTDKNKFKDANLEETKGVRDIIIPNFKPLEAINWLCTQAISNSSKTAGSPYLFYENVNGYNFRSLQSLFDNTVYGKYNYEPKNLTMPDDNRVQDLTAEKYNILSFEPIVNFDSLNLINSGAYSNRLIAVDTIRLGYSITNYDYDKYFKSAKKLNNYSLLSTATNRLNDTTNKTYDSVLKVVTTNTGEVTLNKYIKSHQPTIKDINIETTVPYRTAQIAQINAIKYKVGISGDPLMTVGNVIDFNLPEITRTADGKKPDRFYSGKYLVTAVRHRIDIENKFTTMIEISKESLPNKYDDPDNSSTAWKKVRSK